jgi:hypothetical protein
MISSETSKIQIAPATAISLYHLNYGMETPSVSRHDRLVGYRTGETGVDSDETFPKPAGARGGQSTPRWLSGREAADAVQGPQPDRP